MGCQNRWKHLEYNQKGLGVSKGQSLSNWFVVIAENHVTQILNLLFGRSTVASPSLMVIWDLPEGNTQNNLIDG